jgi:hypothetical protein
MKTLNLNVNFLAQDSTSTSNDPSDAIRINRNIQENFTDAARTFPISVPNLAVDQAVPLSSASVDYLIIHVDQQVSIKLNGSGSSLTLHPISSGVKTPVFLMRGSISSLTVSNSSGQAANLDVISVTL